MGEIVRLQKYIAMCGTASRRGAEALISDGKVTVNGNKIILLGGAKYSKVRYGCYNVMMPGAAGMYALSSDYMVNLFTEKAGCTDLAVAPFRELDVK